MSCQKWQQWTFTTAWPGKLVVLVTALSVMLHLYPLEPSRHGAARPTFHPVEALAFQQVEHLPYRLMPLHILDFSR